MISDLQQGILRILLNQSTDAVAIFQRIVLPKRYPDVVNELHNLLDMGLVESHLVKLSDPPFPISFWSIKGSIEYMQKLLLL